MTDYAIMCVRTYHISLLKKYRYLNPYDNLFHPHLHPHDHIILFRWYSCRMHNYY